MNNCVSVTAQGDSIDEVVQTATTKAAKWLEEEHPEEISRSTFREIQGSAGGLVLEADFVFGDYNPPGLSQI